MNGIYMIHVRRFISSCTTIPCIHSFCEGSDANVRYVDSPLQFARPGIGSVLLYMAIEGLFFFMLVPILEVSGSKKWNIHI